MKLRQIESLCNLYGENTTLKELYLHLELGRTEKCPCCGGTGYHIVNACEKMFPPDIADCSLCSGEGYVAPSVADRYREGKNRRYDGFSF